MIDTNSANRHHEPQMPPCHMWHLGRFFAADQGGEQPPGHRWISWERYKGDLIVYVGARWWLEWAAKRPARA